MREKCKQCPSLIPASRMSKHLELKHNQDLKPGASVEFSSESSDEINDEELEENDDINDGLQNDMGQLEECSEKNVDLQNDTGKVDISKESDEDLQVDLGKFEESDETNDDLQDDSEMLGTASIPKPSKETLGNSKLAKENLGKEEEGPDSDNEDDIVPMRLSKRKRAIIEDDDDVDGDVDTDTDQQPLVKKPGSPLLPEDKLENDDAVGFSTCSYCSLKIRTEKLKDHMNNKHAYLDAEMDEEVTYGGSDLGEVDYEDVEVDYDEEGDDFFEDGNLTEIPQVPAVDPNLFLKEDCDFCDESVLRSEMNEHLLKKHDINFEEDTQLASGKTSSLDESQLVPCPICQQLTAVAVMGIHISYYHATGASNNKEVENGSKEVVKEEEKKEEIDKLIEKEVVSLGERCEMCDERIPVNQMVAHLDYIHDIKVIDEKKADEKLENSSQDETMETESTEEDPFAIPEFLRPKPKRPKFKCHHCQKKFSTREKVDLHVKKRHEGKWRCQVCVTYKLVQENRTIGIMKQLNKLKGVKEDTIPVNDNIQSGQVPEIVYNYEDLYPEEEFDECEECEDDFYWRNKGHSCEVTMANTRIVRGDKLKSATPVSDHAEYSHEEECFEYITSRLGRSLVEKASKEVSTAYVEEVVDDIVNTALDGKQFNSRTNSGPVISRYIRQKRQREDESLQLKSQILAYRYLKKKEALPNIVERAARYENFRDSPIDEIRKLNKYFFEEYKEDIENAEKERFKKNDEARKRLQEETLREMTTAKLYDYSKYFIPTIKATKKAKKVQPKKESKTPLLDSMMMNNSMGQGDSGFKLPTGSALQMNDRNYLNKLKQHQEKTTKKLNMMRQGGSDVNSKQYQDTMRELMVDNRRLENLNKAPSAMNPFRANPVKSEPGIKVERDSENLNKAPSDMNPFRINQVKREPGIKIEPGSLGRFGKELQNIPGVSIKKVEPPPQPPKLEKQEKSSPALQRLQSLGLSISVGQNGQPRPTEPPQLKVESSGQSQPHLPPGLKPKIEPGLSKPYSKPTSIPSKAESGFNKPYPGSAPLPPKQTPGLNRTYPGPKQVKAEPVLNSSVLEQYRQVAGMRQPDQSKPSMRQPDQSKPSMRQPDQPKPCGLWNASARGREPPQQARPQMPPPRPAVRDQTSGRGTYPPSRESFHPSGNNRPLNSFSNRDQGAETFKKPAAPRTYENQRRQNTTFPPARPVSVSKAEFTDSQKLQLKSQILAYRMVARKEKLPGIIKIAASNTNLKGMNIPKNEMRSLSNFFRQEYSGIA